MKSIQGELRRSFIQIILIALALSSLLGFYTSLHEVNELFNAQLVEDARVIRGLLSQPPDKIDWPVIGKAIQEDFPELEDPESYNPSYEKKVALQVWSREGKLLYRSGSAPETPLASMTPGFYMEKRAGHTWHVFTTLVQTYGYVLQVGERAEIRRELSMNIAASLLGSFLVSLAIAFTWLNRRLRTGLYPLAELREAIAERKLDHLETIRLLEQRVEIEPVTEALNHLFVRVSDGVERERRFIADAAHELRTPLSIIKLHAQNALAHDDVERKNQSLQKVLLGVDRNTRVVEQLLLLARLDADADLGGPRQDVRIGGVLQTVVQEMKPLAEAGGRHLAVLIADDEIVIPGMPELVAILFRNLVGNALKYAPEGAVIEADCRIEGNRLVAEVRDDGPGVPDALLDRLANRFVRGESRDVRGSGLGLEIATRIVRLHGGSLHFANRQPHGFCVRAEWPLP